MKQVIQALRTGELRVTDVPAPILRPQGILVRSATSLVSTGTERMVTDFAAKNMLAKARARPDLVRRTLDKARRDGVLNALDSVRARLDQPMPLGYSVAGVVIGVGAQASGFRVGDRVACAGAGYANHAELIYVPRNLAVPLAENVTFEAGAFATVGAIALQGVRQAEITIGARIAVIGLGLIGQLTVQVLRASGCRVFGVDLNSERNTLAMTLGAHDACTPANAEARAATFTDGRGFDAVIIAADSRHSDPITLAGQIARDRAIIVAVGAVGMNVPRAVYYRKELDLRLSRSYGPGRYDPEYEEKGRDYPFAYVRWTEQRNMQTFVELLASGAVNAAPLITHRFTIDDAPRAYEVISGKAGEPSMGVLLTYAGTHAVLHDVSSAPVPIPSAQSDHNDTAIALGVVGAGAFATSTLLPAIKAVSGISLIGIASASGVSAQHNAERFGFAYAADDLDMLLADRRVTWIAILTRHDLHAQQAIAAMQAGKHVYVEKPLALDRDSLAEVLTVQCDTERRLMIGFNRRFAPMIQQMCAFFSDRQRPLIATCRVNAGLIAADHWTQDPTIGGGRIIGEACHFVDLLTFLVGALPIRVYAAALPSGLPTPDEVTITLHFADDSLGTIVYSANGDRGLGKERIEMLGDGKVAVLDDYRALTLMHNGKRITRREWLRPDKGHRAEWLALADAVQHGKPTPITIAEIEAVHLATFAVLDSLRSGQAVTIDTLTPSATMKGAARTDHYI